MTAMSITNSVLEQAEVWGFVCKCTAQDDCQIFPQQKVQKWKLQLVEDKWLLIIDEIPQVRFWPEEASAFLERHRVPTRMDKQPLVPRRMALT